VSYPFVHSHVDLGAASGPRLAFVWHMAEGGGTVAYLAKSNPNGVSVHYVIERTGAIVQMLLETHMHSSINPSKLRLDDDPDQFYGYSAAHSVMGTWWSNPNHASIACEIEGFAAQGPNAQQQAAMARLWADVEARHPGIHSLGHRDFASYKPCPGGYLDWDELGGHGPPATDTTEDEMSLTAVKGEDWKATPDTGAPVRDKPDRTGGVIFARIAKGAIVRTIAEGSTSDGNNWRMSKVGGRLGWLLRIDLEPLMQGGDPAVARGLTDYIDRKLGATQTVTITGQGINVKGP